MKVVKSTDYVISFLKKVIILLDYVIIIPEKVISLLDYVIGATKSCHIELCVDI